MTQERINLIEELLTASTNLEHQGYKKTASLMYRAANELKNDSKTDKYMEWLREQGDLDCGRE